MTINESVTKLSLKTTDFGTKISARSRPVQLPTLVFLEKIRLRIKFSKTDQVGLQKLDGTLHVDKGKISWVKKIIVLDSDLQMGRDKRFWSSEL